MNNDTEHGPGDTIRLLRPPPRVFTDTHGRNVWMGEIEVIELEPEKPVSTDPYNTISKSRDPWSRF